MVPFRAAAAALAIALLGTAAYAAEECCCCKEGAKMECCDKMKGGQPSPKPGEKQQPQPEHQR
jgi:hypothetical protein